MRYLRLFSLTALFALGSIGAYAQSDWGGSYNLEFSKKITPKFSVSLEGEYRTRNNFRSTDRFETTIDASYKLNQMLKVGASYTLINYDAPKNKFRDWEIRHRWSAYLVASYEVNRFKFSLREKFQQTYRMGVPASETDSTFNVEDATWEEYTKERANPKKILRSRLQISYNIRKSKFEPYASIELSNLINDPYDNGLSRIRYTIGTDYKLDKKNVVTLFYRFNNEREKNRSGDETEPNSNYIGVGFSHKF